MVPHLLCAPAEPGRDAAALQAPGRSGPSAGRRRSASIRRSAGLEGLFLDVTGAAHLFGGEAALLAEIQARLADGRASPPRRHAPTPRRGLGAGALAARRGRRSPPARHARGAGRPAGRGPAARRPRRCPLPRRFGLKRIGEPLRPAARGPGAALPRRRRGSAWCSGWTRRWGIEGEPCARSAPPPRYRAWQAFAEPILATWRASRRALPELAEALAAQLERDGQGARALTLTGFRTDGRTTAVEAALGAPRRATAHIWLRLLREARPGAARPRLRRSTP